MARVSTVSELAKRMIGVHPKWRFERDAAHPVIRYDSQGRRAQVERWDMLHAVGGEGELERGLHLKLMDALRVPRELDEIEVRERPAQGQHGVHIYAGGLNGVGATLSANPELIAAVAAALKAKKALVE